MHIVTSYTVLFIYFVYLFSVKIHVFCLIFIFLEGHLQFFFPQLKENCGCMFTCGWKWRTGETNVLVLEFSYSRHSADPVFLKLLLLFYPFFWFLIPICSINLSSWISPSNIRTTKHPFLYNYASMYTSAYALTWACGSEVQPTQMGLASLLLFTRCSSRLTVGSGSFVQDIWEFMSERTQRGGEI